MNFDLTPEQQSIKAQAREFAARELAPFAADWDERAIFPRGVFAKLAALRWAGILCRPEVGGAGCDALTTALVNEELAKGCLATTCSLVVHNCSLTGSAVSILRSAHGHPETRPGTSPGPTDLGRAAAAIAGRVGATDGPGAATAGRPYIDWARFIAPLPEGEGQGRE